MKIRRSHIIAATGAVVLAVAATVGLRLADARQHHGRETYSVEERLQQYEGAVKARLAPDFKRIGGDYPPRRMVLVGLKRERRLEVWVPKEAEGFVLLKTYPILAASGELGPKLAEGDRQVPEGIYGIESLNPNSRYHLALRVNYPNDYDRAKAAAEGRNSLGSDIMIHGKDRSAGCLAMGDEAAEELFVLAARTGIENVVLVLSPVDFRVASLPDPVPGTPAWTPELYSRIKVELAKLRPNPQEGQDDRGR